MEDLDLANRRARVHSKGGAVEWVFWQTGSAQLLPRLLAGRTSGPVFLGDRRPTRAVAGLDLDPASGRARLSYRRAAELFRVRTGWTLHQLRHSALTHAAEDGTNLPLLLARSRHASVRSLERYARPGPEAVARHLAETDPARRAADACPSPGASPLLIGSLRREWDRFQAQRTSSRQMSGGALAMSVTLFQDTTYNLTNLLDDIKRGAMALPDIQRPFVWSSAKTRDLFDSMYRGFPIGT